MAYLQYFSQSPPFLSNRSVLENDKKARYGKYLNFSFLFLELILVNVCFLFVAYLKQEDVITFSLKSIGFASIYNAFWVFLTFALKRYKIGRDISLSAVFKSTVLIVFIHFLLISTLIQFFNHFNFQDYYIALNYTILAVLLPIVRISFLYALKEYRKLGYNYKNIVIIGLNKTSQEFYNYVQSNPALGLNFKGFFSFQENEEHTALDEYKGNLSDFYHYCSLNKVNEVYCAIPANGYDSIADIISFADNNLIRFKIIPDFGGLTNINFDISFYNNVPIITPRHEPLEDLINRAVKRTFDIVFSVLVISFIFPFLFPVLAILVRASSKGPVFFKQLRSGKSNKCFYCYKFRTMKMNRDSDKIQATKHDKRVTRIGKFMRKTNLDELPQFFNVLRGEMSVVGPRPHMLLHTEQYSKLINRYMVRHFVKPGITGWAQVNGYRGNTKATELMEKRIEYDTWYLENWSLWLDLKIVLMTVINLFEGEKNAY
ncbi:undecaprenyl-phosphate glucose phosphotransferase [Chondrinema litorale]|uniref:undecaprenyl-phosphate glucose phosphotransferase n=1 Tax=Chondrinema litorale TaxID=2994555 RepID=UPI002543DB10|nr:undecaprenyl-phosphate glucose phosphotransferase [Chondrinema litorale]UZS00171.1 undecaprenyl-phosphate glucose phosphotransferase [Chondrinema litorale]